jgi:hypothetical protein
MSSLKICFVPIIDHFLHSLSTAHSEKSLSTISEGLVYSKKRRMAILSVYQEQTLTFGYLGYKVTKRFVKIKMAQDNKREQGLSL